MRDPEALAFGASIAIPPLTTLNSEESISKLGQQHCLVDDGGRRHPEPLWHTHPQALHGARQVYSAISFQETSHQPEAPHLNAGAVES